MMLGSTLPLPSQFLLEKILTSLSPLDALEKQHIQETLVWIRSGDPLYRIQKPDVPPKHLVSYFVIFDAPQEKILLGSHIKSGLWLPPGGHVEIDEHPKTTVIRECLEELSIPAIFWKEDPIFLISTLTVGLTAGHTDVSFWYVLKGNVTQKFIYDKKEFNAIHWFNWEDIPYEKSDPHMQRFIAKLKTFL